MTEINQRLLKLIMEDKTLTEISSELNLSNKQIMNRLRTIENSGYNLNRNYYYNGDIRYSLITDFYKKDETTIITRPSDKTFKAILISDLHFGTTKESIEAINTIYDYCCKENIHIIINTGDLVHGKLAPIDTIYINDYEQQFEHLFKNYPYDKSILNFIALGNHDLDSLTQSGFNMHNQLNQKRHDLISLGYDCSKINIKNQEIYIRHSKYQAFQSCLSSPIFFQGHSHFTKIYNSDSSFGAAIPSLSYHMPKNGGISKSLYPMPSALMVEFEFKNGYFKNAVINHLLVNNKIYIINSIMLDILCNRKKCNCQNPIIIKNEEKYNDSIIKKKVLKKDFAPKSQIEKFKNRYNIK